MSVMQTPEGRIDIRQLSIVLGQGGQAFEAVQGLDCQIEAGQFVCVLGPSGCGKSTLLGAWARPNGTGPLMKSLRWWAWKASPGTGRTSSPEACSNGWRSPGCWSTVHGCC